MTGTDSPAPDMPPRAAPTSTELGAALATAEPTAADLARDERTSIFPHDVAVPFQRYALYLAVSYNPYNPASLYFAYAPGESAIVLTRHPEHFAELARADGLTIEAPDAAIAWARAYLETTRTTDEIFYLVSTIDDVQTLTSSPLASDQQVEAFRSEYSAIIHPPEVSPEGPPYDVRIWAIREQSLELHRLRVEESGEIVDSIDVVASDLPLVYSA